MKPVELLISANRLALGPRVPASRISEIIRGGRGISPETALRLAAYLDTSAELWINLQSRYDLQLARDTYGEQIAREVTKTPAA